MTIVRFDVETETPATLHVSDTTAVEAFAAEAFTDAETTIGGWLDERNIEYAFHPDDYSKVVGASTTTLTLFADIPPEQTPEVNEIFTEKGVSITVDASVN